MAEAKTQRSLASVEEFLGTVQSADRRADAEAVCALMREVTGVEPVMWGPSIVGFGQYHYVYATGREGDWPAIGFSPRKAALTLYVSEGFEAYQGLLARLGKHTTGKACLYLKRLSDVDESVLREIIHQGFEQLDGKTITS